MNFEQREAYLNAFDSMTPEQQSKYLWNRFGDLLIDVLKDCEYYDEMEEIKRDYLPNLDIPQFRDDGEEREE